MTDTASPRTPSSPRVVVPVYLDPGFAAGATPMEPVPGLHVVPLGIEQAEAGQKRLRLPFPPNCLISVDADEYEAGARERLEVTGHYRSMKMPPLRIGEHETDPGTFAGGLPIAKWILMSLVLTKPFRFAFGPVFRFRGFHGAETDVERIEPISASFRELAGVQPYRFAGMPRPDFRVPFDGDEFGQTVARLESYFRPYSFRVDRLAVALTSLWSSLCTEFQDQAYVSMTVLVESLLSTQETEITHQLAERTAYLLAAPNRRGIDIYRQVKRLYATRSSIVHGGGMKSKDKSKVAKLSKKKSPAAPQDYPLHMHPLTTTVPMDELRDLTGIGVELLRAFILDDELLRIVQNHDDEGLDNYFLESLLTWDFSPIGASEVSTAATRLQSDEPAPSSPDAPEQGHSDARTAPPVPDVPTTRASSDGADGQT